MPTPDPIALPELPVAVARIHSDGYWTTDDRRPDWKWPARTDVFSSDQMRAYGKACVEALTPAPQVQGDMVPVPREATDVMRVAGEQALGNIDTRWETPDIGEVYAAMLSAAPSTPPLNELLGQPEEFNLNEVSGNSGQLASLEQRARGLLSGAGLQLSYDSRLGGMVSVASGSHVTVDTAIRAITAALSAQPQSEVASEPGAIRTLVAAANAVLALHPADDGMWTLEQAVRPFNAVRPSECENGCPDNQVCDYCQFAAPQPRVTPEHWIEIGKAQALAEFTEQRAAQRRELLAAPQSSEVRSDTNWHECPHCKGWSRATTPQDAAGLKPAAWMATSKPSSDGTVAIQFTHNPDYANECRRADWTVMPLYTTPPPGVDVGKLRELVAELRESEDRAAADAANANEDRDAYAHGFERDAYKDCADQLAALIGDGGEKGNG